MASRGPKQVRRPMMVLALALVGILGLGPASVSGPVDLPREELLDHTRFLASDELMGRGVGTPGIAKARDYIAKQFEKYGLSPGGKKGSYFQELSMTTGVRPRESSSLAIAGHRSLALGDDWVPLGLSGTGNVEGRVVFAGYGITAKEYGYDDYDGLDAEGKIVLVLRYEPPFKIDKRRLGGVGARSPYSGFSFKADNARSHGAIGMILVDMDSSSQAAEELIPTAASFRPAKRNFLAVQIRRRIVEEWFRNAGLSLDTLKKRIDRDRRPLSGELSDHRVSIRVSLEEISQKTDNVIAFLAGSDPEGKGESVVIGAHYDHLGLGYARVASVTHEGEIHNGADDNASGVAVLLSVARRLAALPRKFPCSIVFVAFTAEELDLNGSRHYVKDAPFPISRTRAMINLDMVGRMRPNRLTVFGIDSAREFRPRVNGAALNLGLEIVPAGSTAFGESDHRSFYEENIPVLHFFTGKHEDYHQPTDDWDKLNLEGMEKVTNLAVDLVQWIASERMPLTFTRPRSRDN